MDSAKKALLIIILILITTVFLSLTGRLIRYHPEFVPSYDSCLKDTDCAITGKTCDWGGCTQSYPINKNINNILHSKVVDTLSCGVFRMDVYCVFLEDQKDPYPACVNNRCKIQKRYSNCNAICDDYKSTGTRFSDWRNRQEYSDYLKSKSVDLDTQLKVCGCR